MADDYEHKSLTWGPPPYKEVTFTDPTAGMSVDSIQVGHVEGNLDRITPEDWAGYNRLVGAADKAIAESTPGRTIIGVMVNVLDIKAVQRIIESEF